MLAFRLYWNEILCLTYTAAKMQVAIRQSRVLTEVSLHHSFRGQEMNNELSSSAHICWTEDPNLAAAVECPGAGDCRLH